MTLPEQVAVIGGGRWARVLASVAGTILPRNTVLHLCSPGNNQGWQQWRAEKAPRAVIAPSLEVVMQDQAISHVLIARNARDLASTTLAALKAGKQVFVEKPFATRISEAEDLVAKARGRRCMTGLVFRFAPNVREFARACLARGAPSRFEIVWSDPPAETRHGEKKGYDPGLNIAWDIFPHIWSILRLFVADGPMRLLHAKATRGGSELDLQLGMSGGEASVTMRRNDLARRRLLRVSGEGWSARIDFSEEPGQAEVDGAAIDVASVYSSPLALELTAFFQGKIDPFCEPGAAIEALRLADEAGAVFERERIRQVQIARSGGPADHARYAVQEVLGSALGREGGGLFEEYYRFLAGDISAKDVSIIIRNNPALAEFASRVREQG